MTTIPDTPTWTWFRSVAAELWPGVPAPPRRGCWPEAGAWLKTHGLLDAAVATVRQAPGNRAWAIYYARRDGWWPAESAVADIREAPGNRAWAIYCARDAGWWPEESAVADIREAPGNRAWVIYCARDDGWWPAD
ncbi:MAG: hypothetical protein AB7O86_12270 [Porticoccaceae bacterium]